ncbi:MAG: STAS domain-containing protein [Planctomycetota bacterium]
MAKHLDVHARSFGTESVLLRLKGRLTFRSFQEFQRAMADHLTGRRRHVVIDLDGLSVMTVVGAAGFIAMLRLLQDHQLRVEIIEPPADLLTTFEAFGVDLLLPRVFREEVPQLP